MSLPIQQVRDLPTSELAIAILKQLAAQDQISLYNELTSVEGNLGAGPDRQLILNKLSDAFAWIQSRGLVGPIPGGGAGSTWQRLTTEGRELAESSHAIERSWATDRLAGVLDPALEDKIRPLFSIGDYETACFAAMKEVEIAVRAAAGLDNSVIGRNVMKMAFTPKGGPLTDPGAEAGEQTSVMELFSGAIGAFKNPSSHRTVVFDDPVEASEIIQLADLLLRLLRRAERRLAAPSGN